jgi:hypothetical protein
MLGRPDAVGESMTELVDGWEIMARRAKNPIFQLFALLQVALGIAEAPHAFSAATWALRQTSTGIVRKVTAYSEAEARERLALGLFDDA